MAFVASDYSGYTENTRLAIIHDPAFGTPIGGSGGGPGGTGGTGGMGGAGGTGGAPNPCPGCSVATVPAYGLHMAADASRNLIYVAAHAQAVSHPSSIVTVDAAAAAVTSIVPVGNDPQPLALSDDASALWVGLAGDHRVRRMTPGTTPVPGPAYALPMLLTTNEPASPFSVVVLPGMPGSIAVGVYGANLGGRGVFILDDGLLRANYVQPPEVPAYFLTNGPPGYLLGLGDYGSLVAFRLGSVGATYETYGGLITGGSYGLTYSAGYLYSSSGEVVDLRNPDDPLLNGRFAFNSCLLALRSATRVMMVCPTSDPTTGPVLHMLDPDTFTSVGSVTLPPSLQAASWVDFAYLGGDGVALLGDGHAAADHARPAHRLPALRSDRHDVADRGRKKRRAQQRERERRAAIPGKQGEDPGKRAVVEDNQGDGAGELQSMQHPQRRPAAQRQQREIGAANLHGERANASGTRHLMHQLQDGEEDGCRQPRGPAGQARRDSGAGDQPQPPRQAEASAIRVRAHTIIVTAQPARGPDPIVRIPCWSMEGQLPTSPSLELASSVIGMDFDAG